MDSMHDKHLLRSVFKKNYVILKVILSLVEGSHLLTPSVCLFDIGVVCFYNMTDIRSDDHYNSDESVPGYSFGR